MAVRGDKVTYRCLAGFYYDAEVRAIRLDGRADIAIKAGCNEPFELPRIVVVNSADRKVHLPGTCTTALRETP